MTRDNPSPIAVAVLAKEGREWIPFDSFEGKLVHAIRFSDGSIWDAVNGWRGKLQ